MSHCTPLDPRRLARAGRGLIFGRGAAAALGASWSVPTGQCEWAEFPEAAPLRSGLPNRARGDNLPPRARSWRRA